MDVNPRMRLLLLVGSIVIALTIAACGAAPSTAGTDIASEQSATVPASTTSTVASPSQPTPGGAAVVLAPGTTHYAVSDTITITVQNTTGRTIYALAQFTGCSIISLGIVSGRAGSLYSSVLGNFRIRVSRPSRQAAKSRSTWSPRPHLAMPVAVRQRSGPREPTARS